MTLEFWVTTLVVVAIPGTGVIYTLATGLTRGPQVAVVAAAGCTLGIVPHMLAAITGLAALLHASGVAFAVLKYLGVGYLLWMAWTTWRDTGTLRLPTPGERAPSVATWRVVGNGIALNLLNPKLTIFFVAFLPQFLPAGAQPLPLMLAMSGAFMAVTFAVFVLYGLAAGAVRHQVVARPRIVVWARRSFAVAFAALAGRLALAER